MLGSIVNVAVQSAELSGVNKRMKAQSVRTTLSWGMQTGTATDDYYNDIIPVGDDHLVAVGFKDSLAYAVKTTKTGTNEWSVSYNSIDRPFQAGAKDNLNHIIASAWVDASQGQTLVEIDYADGSVVWSRDHAHCMAAVAIHPTDQSIYAAGHGLDSTTYSLVVQYNATGHMMWEKRLNAGVVDVAFGLAVDVDGNLVVVGAHCPACDVFDVDAASKDAFIAKLSPEGEVLWIKKMGTLNSPDVFSDVAVTSTNAYIVVGSTQGSLFGQLRGDQDYALLRIAAELSASNRLRIAWSTQFGSELYDENPVLALSPTSDNIFVGGGGYMDRAGSSIVNMLLAKVWGANGNVAWIERLEPSDTIRGVVSGLTCEGDDIYVAGAVWGNTYENTYAGSMDASIAKYADSTKLVLAPVDLRYDQVDDYCNTTISSASSSDIKENRPAVMVGVAFAGALIVLLAILFLLISNRVRSAKVYADYDHDEEKH
ncbi:hypothetical protein EON65_34620 [archaeon]|nr:MAG: hypothetical protein EON65_34620 [archaeon]